VYTAPVAMLKRAHHFPRLVLNRLGAYSTDTAYRIQPMECSAESLVYSFFNSLTCLCAELEGRHYGGGVLELVPSEIERLLLPKFDATERQVRALDERFRSVDVPSELLPIQDAKILTSVGLSKVDAATLHAAWSRLRNRRQRVSSQPD
jgi:adenine-specific DNA-methyltransferase